MIGWKVGNLVLNRRGGGVRIKAGSVGGDGMRKSKPKIWVRQYIRVVGGGRPPPGSLLLLIPRTRVRDSDWVLDAYV